MSNYLFGEFGWCSAILHLFCSNEYQVCNFEMICLKNVIFNTYELEHDLGLFQQVYYLEMQLLPPCNIRITSIREHSKMSRFRAQVKHLFG